MIRRVPVDRCGRANSLIRHIVVLPGIFVLAACDGRQSALAPAGREALALADLFWSLLVGAVVLWLAVNGLFLYVTRLNPKPLSRRLAESIIIGGGILFPTFVLCFLLWYALSLMPMPMQRAPGDAGGPSRGDGGALLVARRRSLRR